jgi:hypothetical protein
VEEEAAAPRKICSFMHNSSLKSWSSLSSLLAVVVLLHVQVKTDSLQESNKIYKPLQKIRYSYTRVGKSLKLSLFISLFHKHAIAVVRLTIV